MFLVLNIYEDTTPITLPRSHCACGVKTSDVLVAIEFCFSFGFSFGGLLHFVLVLVLVLVKN